jgi:hypothetical protein
VKLKCVKRHDTKESLGEWRDTQDIHSPVPIVCCYLTAGRDAESTDAGAGCGDSCVHLSQVASLTLRSESERHLEGGLSWHRKAISGTRAARELSAPAAKRDSANLSI